jgi:predicted ATP-dependent Lon-type protease
MVNSGEFYKKFYTRMYPDQPFNKAEAKLIVLFIMFSKNRTRSSIKKDFKSAFPEVYKLFAEIKKKNHTALSHILQRIESEIIIQRVTKRISIEKPNLPIFTIHDSVATLQGSEKYVSSVIEEEVKNATGLDVKLGLEYWNP